MKYFLSNLDTYPLAFPSNLQCRTNNNAKAVIAPKVLASPKVATSVAIPKVASPKVASPKVASPKVASPKVASPKVASPKVATFKVLRLHLLSPSRNASVAAKESLVPTRTVAALLSIGCAPPRTGNRAPVAISVASSIPSNRVGRRRLLVCTKTLHRRLLVCTKALHRRRLVCTKALHRRLLLRPKANCKSANVPRVTSPNKPRNGSVMRLLGWAKTISM
jgi:hypothetical protein